MLDFTLLAADAGSWWEPGTPNFLDVGDVSAILGLIGLACGMIYTVSKIWMKLLRAIIREEITEATAPIHPAANGGLSLADVARKTSQLEAQMCRIEKQNDETKNLIIKVLSQAVIIPDTAPADPKTARSRSKKTS